MKHTSETTVAAHGGNTLPLQGESGGGPTGHTSPTAPYQLFHVPQRNYSVPIPAEMAAEPLPTTYFGYMSARFRHDFQFWAENCLRMRNPTTGRYEPFQLNGPQQRILVELERQRRAGHGIRLILLKARGCGSTTLCLAYIMWLQLMRTENRNAIICGPTRAKADGIIDQYNTFINHYPDLGRKLYQDYYHGDLNWGRQDGFLCPNKPPKNPNDLWHQTLWPSDKRQQQSPSAPTASTPSPFRGSKEGGPRSQEGAQSYSYLLNGTPRSSDCARGFPISFALHSDAAFWCKSARELISSINSSIGVSCSDSAIILESAAHGHSKRNFFHSEWQRAEQGGSYLTPLFIPWYEIETNRRPLGDAKQLIAELDDYELLYLKRKLRLDMDQINWYHQERRKYPDMKSMMEANPTTPQEAFYGTLPKGIKRNRLSQPYKLNKRTAAIGGTLPLQGELGGGHRQTPRTRASIAVRLITAGGVEKAWATPPRSRDLPWQIRSHDGPAAPPPLVGPRRGVAARASAQRGTVGIWPAKSAATNRPPLHHPVGTGHAPSAICHPQQLWGYTATPSRSSAHPNSN